MREKYCTLQINRADKVFLDRLHELTGIPRIRIMGLLLERAAAEDVLAADVERRRKSIASIEQRLQRASR